MQLLVALIGLVSLAGYFLFRYRRISRDFQEAVRREESLMRRQWDKE